jgi:hypothetical protein
VPKLDVKFGKRAPQNKAAIPLGQILTRVIPPHPLEVHHLNIGGWQMLGNDKYGDCVAVTWADIRRLMTRLAGREQYPNLDQVLELYRTQNPGFPQQDDGMYVQQTLEHLHRSGGPDGAKLVAFARVDHTDQDELEAAIAIFGYVWTGVAIRRQVMVDFYNNRPWDFYPASPISGYHSIIVAGYDSDHVGRDKECKTWGTVTGFTEAFWAHDVDECYVGIWEEHLGTNQFQTGVDVENLAVIYKDLTGRELPIPDPPPTPEPETLDDELAAAFKRWRGSRKSWSGKTAAGQLVKTGNEWLEEKGL